MRKPSKVELGLLVGVVIATGLAHAEEGLDEVVVQGYQYDPFWWLNSFANDYATTPQGGSGPGGVYSANPTAHVNCVANRFSAAMKAGYTVGPGNPAPQPNNTALPIPVRYDKIVSPDVVYES
jgi:hypothetical protein